jgi:uncharacterized membrane protein YGL010W
MAMTEHDAGTALPSQWLGAYAADHSNRANRLVHGVCIPLTAVGIVGLLWSAPVPEAFRASSPILNWGTIFLMATMVYYFIISIYLAIGMLPFIVLTLAAVAWLGSLATPLWAISGGILVLAFAGQCVGHWLEGKMTPVFRDLHLLIIGPLWLLAGLYRCLGIPY